MQRIQRFNFFDSLHDLLGKIRKKLKLANLLIEMVAAEFSENVWAIMKIITLNFQYFIQS